MTVVTSDVLSVDLVPILTQWLGAPPSSANQIRVVGNLPYNISSPILFALIELASKTHGVRDATLMLQKEVADRLVAKVGTGEYGVLTVLTGLNADVTRVLSLPPGAFRPQPKVHSAVVRLTFRPPHVDIADQQLFVRMVRTMFTQRRKTLSNALKPFAVERGVDAAGALSGGGNRSEAPARDAQAGRDGCAGARVRRGRKLKLCYSFRRNPARFPGAPSGLKR